MFKTVSMFKRHPSLTVEQFKDHYENIHVPLALRNVKGKARRYIRKYPEPRPNPMTGMVAEPEYDVVMEFWHDDKQAYEAMMASMKASPLLPEIIADEERLFDRPKSRNFFIDERVTEVPQE